MKYLRIRKAFVTTTDDWAIVRAMSPAELLSLAKDHSNLRDRFAAWDESKIDEWPEWPYLWVDPETRQVHGHEGRARIFFASMAGYDLVDVILYAVPDALRDLGTDWEWDGHMPETAELISEREYTIWDQLEPLPEVER